MIDIGRSMLSAVLHRKMQWPDDKEFFGYSPSQWETGLAQTPCPTRSPGYGVKASLASPGTNTGKCLWPSPPKSLFPKLLESLEKEFMQNSLDPDMRKITAGKKRLELKELSSNLDPSHFKEIRRLIGNLPGLPPLLAISCQYQPVYVYVVTGQYAQLLQIMNSLLAEQSIQPYFGAVLELARRSGLGRRPDHQLIVRILDQNFGAATWVKETLLLTNFEEALTSRTFCDGWIVTLVELKLKDPVDLFEPQTTGLLRTSHRTCGTQTSTLRRKRPFYGE